MKPSVADLEKAKSLNILVKDSTTIMAIAQALASQREKDAQIAEQLVDYREGGKVQGMIIAKAIRGES